MDATQAGPVSNQPPVDAQALFDSSVLNDPSQVSAAKETAKSMFADGQDTPQTVQKISEDPSLSDVKSLFATGNDGPELQTNTQEEAQKPNTDVIGEGISEVEHPVKSEENVLNKASSGWNASTFENLDPFNRLVNTEINNIKQNSMVLSAARVLGGDTQHQQAVESLKTQQNNLLAQLHTLQLNPSKNSYQIAGLQGQISSLNNQMDAMNVSVLHQKWSSLAEHPGDTLKSAWTSLKALGSAFIKSPETVLKNFGNQMLADPWFLATGNIFDGAGAVTATDDATAVAKTSEVASKLAGASRIASSVASNGLVKTAAINGAIFTPLSLAQTYDQTGTVTPNDVIRASVQGLALGTAFHLAHTFFSPKGADINAIRNDAAVNGRTLLEAAKSLGIDTETPGRETVASSGTVTNLTTENPVKAVARGMEVNEIQVPNQAYAMLQTVAKSGGTYRADDLIDPKVPDQMANWSLLHMDTFNRNLKDSGRAGLLGLQDVGMDYLMHNTHAVSGKLATALLAHIGNDGVDIFHTASDGTKKGFSSLVRAHADMADRGISLGKPLNSLWSLDPGDAAIWTKGLKARGYNVEQSPFSIYDAYANRVKTINGEPVFKVTGKLPEAPETEEANMVENAHALGKQVGAIDPELAKRMLTFGAIGAAAAYGYHTGGIHDALRDSLVAGAAILFTPAIARGIMASHGVKNLGELDANHIALQNLDSAASQINSVPVLANWIKNNVHALVGGDYDNLAKNLYGSPDAQPMTPGEQAAHDYVKTLLTKIGQRAQNAGIIKNMVDDYFMRWWKPAPGSPLEGKWNKNSFRFSRTLGVGTEGFKEASKMGLAPVTDDVGEMMRHYIQSMHQALVLKETATTLRSMVDENGEKLIKPALEAPRNFVNLKGNAFAGMKAHPDIALPINMLYDYPDPTTLWDAYDMATFVLKRSLFSFSLFHPKNLGMNYLMATGDLKGMVNAFRPNSMFRQALKYGDPDNPYTDKIKLAAKSNLTFAISTTTEDWGNDPYYRFLDGFSNKLDKIVPGSGILPKGIKAISHASDKIAFEMAQNYFKFHTWARIYDHYKEAALSRHLLNPDKYPLQDDDEIGRKAALVANDLYGSQNYYHMISSMKPGMIKQVLSEVYSPSGRQELQRGGLAPDWATSVIRSYTGVLRPGMRGAYLRYLAGAASFYLAAAGASYIASGKFPWQTLEEPGYIDLGNGSRLQWDKQVSEIMEYGQNPQQAILNKLGPVPRIMAEGLLNRKYLSPGEGKPIYNRYDSPFTAFTKVVVHGAEQNLPIGAQQGMESPTLRAGLIHAAGSELGFPLYPQYSSPTVIPPQNDVEKMQARLAARLRRIEEGGPHG